MSLVVNLYVYVYNHVNVEHFRKQCFASFASPVFATILECYYSACLLDSYMLAFIRLISIKKSILEFLLVSDFIAVIQCDECSFIVLRRNMLDIVCTL